MPAMKDNIDYLKTMIGVRSDHGWERDLRVMARMIVEDILPHDYFFPTAHLWPVVFDLFDNARDYFNIFRDRDALISIVRDEMDHNPSFTLDDCVTLRTGGWQWECDKCARAFGLQLRYQYEKDHERVSAQHTV